MMVLQDKLNEIRKSSQSNIPPEVLRIMHDATDGLVNSGIMDGVLKTGDKAPVFSLRDQNGDMVSSSELMAGGPVVVSFYRGVW